MDEGVANEAARRAELERLDRLANLLDASVTVPGTRFRIGVDALIGLVPGIGDLLTAAIALWIVGRGYRLGARRRTVARMLWNTMVDLVVGTVPVAGDVFDAVWKANRRNVDLLLADLDRPGE